MTEEDWNVLGWEIQDSFSPAAPVNEASLIAGRKMQIGKLTDAVFERGRHAILFGERGVGKTSIANTFHMRFSSGPKSIISIRKPAFPTDTFSSLWKRVFAEFTVEDGGQRLSDVYPGEIGPDDVVREMSNFSLNTLPIIIIDEFDKFTDNVGKRTMSHTIKALSDDVTSNATIVLVGVAEDVNLLVEEHASISRNIIEIKMPRMSKPEMEEIIDQRYPTLGLTIDIPTKERIATLSRGLPEYVHFLARDAARNAVKGHRKNVKKEDVTAAMLNMIENADQTLADKYHNAVLSNKKNNLYRQVLLACAVADSDDMGRFTPSDVMVRLKQILGRDIKIANFFPHIEAFCTIERGSILEKKGTQRAYKYRFKEPKVQPYVFMKGVSDEMISEDAFLSN